MKTRNYENMYKYNMLARRAWIKLFSNLSFDFFFIFFLCSQLACYFVAIPCVHTSGCKVKHTRLIETHELPLKLSELPLPSYRVSSS